jgi:hypothetical protein
MSASRGQIVAALIGAVALILAALIAALLSSARQSNNCPADHSSHSTCINNSLDYFSRSVVVTGAVPEDHNASELPSRMSDLSRR